MATSSSRLYDSIISDCGYTRKDMDDSGMRGYGYAELFDGDGSLVQYVPFVNLITNWGDQYYATRGFPILTAQTVTVLSWTNADPPVFTTSAAHGLGVGDVVKFSGGTAPATLTGIPSLWVINAVGSTTTFTVDVGLAPGATGTSNITVVASAAAQTYPVANGMKLGTGSTAMNKTTPTGMDLTTYGTGVTGNKAFDATYPQFANLGNGLGATATYKTTWNAGEATVSGLNEVAIIAEWPFTDTATTSGATKGTVSRAILSPVVNKGASDTLAITWLHKFLGA